ncbi:MAG TPA: CRTAC1 family protein [Verrucomicrobiae bacterium]|nr:CRTAC1 family protein [Verrucomicrobiae bacterium]
MTKLAREGSLRTVTRVALHVVIANILLLSLVGAEPPLSKENTQTPHDLAEYGAKQFESAKGLGAFHGFQFSDRREESGITFRERAVDDASKTWTAAHYDHGAGVAAADVDGDGLADIYFVNQLGGNELWRNLGNGKFENITAKAGVALAGRICVAAAFADVDNDGLPDLFVTTVRMGNVLFKNLGGGKFQDISKSAGVDFVGHSSGAVFFDFNNDGLLDLFVANVGVYTTDERGAGGFYRAMTNAFLGHLFPERARKSLLYQNLGGGKFKDVTEEMHLVNEAWSGDAAVCDLNGDGYPDLYVLNMQGQNHYFENQRGKGFVDKTAQYFPKTPWGAMGVKFFDFNQDGLMDLFITDMHSDMTKTQTKLGKTNFRQDFDRLKSDTWCGAEWGATVMGDTSRSIFGNAFYLNKGNGKFAEVSDDIGAETYWPWGMSVGDVNADGYEDVFVTAGMGYPFRYQNNTFLLNDGGKKFVNAEFVLGIEPRRNNHLETDFFTLDCSGADKDDPLCYHKKGMVTVRGSASTRSTVMLDVDGDGDLDIISNEVCDYPMVLISNLSAKQPVHFLKIRLTGTKSNRDGLGAVVKVSAGGHVWTQANDGKSGYLAQSVLPLYFGLGAAAKPDQVEILWPSGAKQVITRDIPSNSLLKITEGTP